MPTIKDSSSIEEVLQYIVACYGAAIYQEKQRLSNLIADLYTGEERSKRLYRRMVMEDAVSQQLYAISLKPIQEREGFYNRLVYQFKEANFYEEAFARQVLDVFLHGMNLLLVEPISTKATEKDGEWYDEYGVKYSADRKKLISVPSYYQCSYYSVLDGTVVICDDAFNWCENLQEITLSLCVTSIGDRAFGGCWNLQKITLPSSVTNIGDEVFYGCWNLKEINVTERNKVYRAIDGVLYTKDLKTIICYPKGKENKKFVIPQSVTSIGNSAFESCKNLQEITLPSSVTSIGNEAFYWCSNLKEINVAERNKVYKAIDGVLYTKDLKSIICYPKGKENKKFVISLGVTNIGKGAFGGCMNLQEISLPSGVTSIGDNAFHCCENLKEINIPPSITSIGNSAFESCKNLQEITLSQSVTSIGDYAFSGCWHLKEINQLLSVTSIGDNAFSWCKNLREIILPSSITSIGKEIFDYCPNLQRINIPAGTLEKFKKLLPDKAHLLYEV